jgi:hypothetical protein
VIKAYYETFIDIQGIKSQTKDTELKGSLQKKLELLFTDIFKLLGLYYPRKDIVKVYQNLKTGTKDSIAFAIEGLDSSLKKDIRDIILPMIEDLSDFDRLRIFRQRLKHFPKA